MKDIEFHVVYRNGDTEKVRVSARDINSGYVKALKVAREPLGNGRVRDIGAIEFRQYV